MNLKCGKKKSAIIIIIGIVTVAICITVAVIISRAKKKSEATQFTPETATYSEIFEEILSEEETVSETASETAPIIKPVGTTAPVERAAPAIPKKITPQKPNITPTKLLNVPFIDQRKKYPTGCESVSAVMALQYLGISISPETFIDNYLDKGRTPYRDENGNLFGDDPRKVFLGDPYSKNGWGCWAPVIENAVNKFIGSNYTVKAVYGSSVDDLCKKYIDNDIPVLIWATQNMAPARKYKTWYITGTSDQFTWITPMHCLLLVGYDDSGYYFNDPLQSKNTRYAKDKVISAYNMLNRQAVVIAPKSKVEDTTVTPTTAPNTTTEPTTKPTATTEPTTKATEPETSEKTTHTEVSAADNIKQASDI